MTMDEERIGAGLDIRKTAGLLFGFHGRRALRIAATRANILAESGDRGGAIEWLRISEAVREIIRQETER
ncbi:hypothetical protein [Ferrovibrio terrae]|uniref:hypothetical protein n=1 Tax=Ferrovibrio terrae TaxID=2594003 RepID=UPI00313826F4